MMCTIFGGQVCAAAGRAAEQTSKKANASRVILQLLQLDSS
jgi:hypothetical protein